MEAKTILFGMPVRYGIHLMIEKNLRYAGFNPINIAYEDADFRYPSFGIRFKTKWKQLICRDKEAKWKLKSQLHFEQHVRPKIEAAGTIDRCLFIRGDIYHPDELLQIKELTKTNIINYQWDGVDRFPDFYRCQSFFDKIFVFDPNDLNKNSNFYPATNFYFDCFTDSPNIETEFYFSGAHHPSRTELINRFAKFIEHNIDKPALYMLMPGNKLDMRATYPSKSIHLMYNTFDFQENLSLARRTRCLLDFLNPVHNGLSFRVFEALGYDKKLITTNPAVKDYDFYRPENIHIWDGKDFDSIEQFLQIPYHPLPITLKEKYSFSNWIRYILDIPPYQSILLP